MKTGFRRILPACALLLAVGAPSVSSKKDRREPAASDPLVKLLQAYVRIDTTNPPGNEEAAARFLKNILDAEGIATQVFVSTAGRANLLAKLPSASASPEPPLLLLHHIDVVPADPAQWSVPPFEGVIKDDYLWGRGAIDTKITGILQLNTLLNLKRNNVPLNRDVYMLAVADEEAGGFWGLQWMLDKMGDRLKPGFVIDEGGFGFKNVFTNDGRTVYAVAIEEKKVLGLRVTAHGRAGHGALPNTENPTEILRKALDKIERAFVQERPRPPASVADMEAQLGPLRKTGLAQAIRRNTFEITSLTAYSGDPLDPKDNVVPAEAVATLDCRLLPTQAEFDLLHRLREAVADKRVTVEITRRTQDAPPARSYKTPLYSALKKAVKEHDPAAVVVPLLYPAATDSRFFRARGAACYGFVPVVLTEKEFYGLHAADEKLPLDGLEKASRIMYDWVKTFVEVPAAPPSEDAARSP